MSRRPPRGQDHASGTERRVDSQLRAVGLAALVTLLAVAAITWETPIRVLDALVRRVAPVGGVSPHIMALLALGLVLTIPTRHASGLRVGNIREHWKRVLVVCAIPVLATALVYPRLPERPFAGAGPEMWFLSPLAQDLVFMGFLYGMLEPAFPRYVHARVPVRWALLVGAAFFAAWHLPNLGAMSNGYLAFQLAYTSVGFVLTGLSRQWTGSMLYVTASHSAVNLVAWWTS